MNTRRRGLAWFMLLTLVFILGLTCFASAHAHNCLNESVCPICLYLNSGSRLAVLTLSLLFATLIVSSFQQNVSDPTLTAISLVIYKIRMNN